MPNWCYNNVDITAKTPEQMELLVRVSKRDSETGVFDILRPMPEALKGTVKGTGEEAQEVFVDGVNNWYDWAVNNWGTKWDVDPISEEFDGETMSLSFDSAWAPPTALYEFLVEQGFDVSANYYEPGCDFAGEWVNGDDFYLENLVELARKDPETLSIREYDILEMFNIWEEVAQYDDLDDEMVIDES